MVMPKMESDRLSFHFGLIIWRRPRKRTHTCDLTHGARTCFGIFYTDSHTHSHPHVPLTYLVPATRLPGGV